MAGNKREKGDGKGRQGGRKKGTPNHITGEKRAILSKFMEERWDDFLASYDAIDDPEKKCTIMVSILSFIVPKLSSVEYKDKDAPKTFRDELDEISGEKTRS